MFMVELSIWCRVHRRKAGASPAANSSYDEACSLLFNYTHPDLDQLTTCMSTV
jgi:hypothetical protein